MKGMIKSMDMSSPLARARGHGASKEGGTHHWWSQRLSAMALVPLSLWFVFSVVALAGVDQAAFAGWVSELGNMVLMSLFVIALFSHIGQGMQVVIEDYVHAEPAKLAMLLMVKAFIYVGGASCLVSIVIVAFGN